MKIASFHKDRGDSVEWFLPLLTNSFEKIYVSKLFTFTPDVDIFHQDIIRGGTGYCVSSVLPDEIEASGVDYSIYPNCDFSVQFFSRGCPRKCSFCVVPEKEGGIRPVEPLLLNPRGKYIHVMDNNFFANPEWRGAIKYLKELGQPVKFEGVDIRLMTEEQAKAINEIPLKSQIHIAWDFPKDKIDEHIERVLSYGHLKARKLMSYVLIGYKSSPAEDLIRVERLRDLGVDPYVMPYNKKDEYEKRFARWVNHKAIFKSVKWEEYKK